MYFPPKLKQMRQTKKVISTFGGLNTTPTVADGEFADISNMTADAYPVLKTRDKRYIVETYNQENDTVDLTQYPRLYVNRELFRLIPQKDGAFDRLVCGGETIVDWQRKELSKTSDLPTGMTAKDITFASIGAYTIVMPFKAWIKQTINESGAYEYTCGKLAYDYTKSGDVSIRIAFEDGDEVKKFSYGTDYPKENVVDDQLHRISTRNAFFRCIKAPDVWEEISKVRYKISAVDSADGKGAFPAAITDGDGVTFGDFLYDYINEDQTTKETATPFSNKVVTVGDLVNKDGYDYFTITAEPDGKMIVSLTRLGEKGKPLQLAVTSFSFERKCPDMKYVCASANRIWGCDLNGNEIYASALGDIFNFYKFEGISDDSWTATVGEGDKWTGCATLNGTPCFFKRDRVFVVSGSRPSSFGYNEISLAGCVDNESIAVVKNTMFYMSEDGVYAFSGGTPTKISDKITGKWLSGVGGAWRDKYYLCREYEPDKYHLLIFDTSNGLWHKEDTRWYAAQHAPERLYYIAKDGEFFSLRSPDPATNESILEDELSWYAETGDREAIPSGNNYITEIDITLSVEGNCDISIQYDGSGDWKYIGFVEDVVKRDRKIRFAPRRCQYYRLRFEGKGETTIHSITEIVEEANEYV